MQQNLTRADFELIREVSDAIDLTDSATYSLAKELGFPEQDCLFMAKDDYCKQDVINPGYKSYFNQLLKAKFYSLRAFNELIKERQCLYD
jgi:hypothetical protein